MIAEYNGVGGAITLTAIAFTVVILVLSTMAAFMRGMGAVVDFANRLTSRAKPVGQMSAAGAAANASTDGDGADDETVSAITAAVTTMLGHSRFRIASIRPGKDERPGWTVKDPGNTPDMNARWRKR
ncbi:OadG family protein [Myxococcota bacterium]|nr:OadG family protein [Myxococcota bacterium]HOD07546.1 OadG family transporter subunit [Myxococcota bacterium]